MGVIRARRALLRGRGADIPAKQILHVHLVGQIRRAAVGRDQSQRALKVGRSCTTSLLKKGSNLLSEFLLQILLSTYLRKLCKSPDPVCLA